MQAPEYSEGLLAGELVRFTLYVAHVGGRGQVDTACFWFPERTGTEYHMDADRFFRMTEPIPSFDTAVVYIGAPA